VTGIVSVCDIDRYWQYVSCQQLCHLLMFLCVVWSLSVFIALLLICCLKWQVAGALLKRTLYLASVLELLFCWLWTDLMSLMWSNCIHNGLMFILECDFCSVADYLCVLILTRQNHRWQRQLWVCYTASHCSTRRVSLHCGMLTEP